MIVGFRSPLTSGDYTLIVSTDLPKFTPPVNLFDVTGRLNNVVVDGKYGIPGGALQKTYSVSNALLYWSSATLDAECTVTLGFYLNGASNQIASILLLFPPEFTHSIQSDLQVKSLNREFPYNPDFWVDYNRTNALRIMVDDTVVIVADKRVNRNFIDAGLYRFSFPVMVPRHIPSYNVWYVVICSDRECETKTDKSAQVMLPVGGFEAGQECLKCPAPLSTLVESSAAVLHPWYFLPIIPLLIQSM